MCKILAMDLSMNLPAFAIISIVKEGKNILIGFNPKFFIEALRVIDDEEVTLYMTNPKAPCFIKNAEESYIYLILPVNLGVVK